MRRIFAGVFLVALTTLLMELLLLRVFEVILYPTFAYMIITCAMFCFGLAGVYTYLKPFPANTDVRPFISRISLLFGASSLAILPIMNLLPFDFQAIAEAPVIQLLSFLGMYFFLAIPFFCAGLIVSTVFSVYAHRIQSLYFWDLTGAALGCIILIPFLPWIGPGGLVFCACACGLWASGLFNANKAWTCVTVSLGVLVFMIPFFYPAGYIEFHQHQSKRGLKEALKQGTVEFTYWDPVSKIDVVDQSSQGRKHIAYDGGSQSSHIYSFDGNFQRLRSRMPDLVQDHFWQRGVLASHYLKRDSHQRVLVIGSAAGQETKAALMYGAAHVDAIEMVRIVVDIGKHKYAAYNGNIFNHPRVHVRVGEGRSFLRTNNDRYDIIQIFSNHISSSMAAGSFAFATSYLQTVESYQEYFNHLEEDGVLHVNHHFYPRLVTTAARAWKLIGRDDFQKHVVVFSQLKRESATWDTVWWDDLPTFLVKKRPWTDSEINELKTFFSVTTNEERQFELMEDPLHPESSFLPASFYSGNMPTELAQPSGYLLTPPTDDKPYFNFWRRTISRGENFLGFARANRGILHFLVTGFVSLSFAVVVIFVPLFFSKNRTPVKWPGLAYFSCLGTGFIIIELIFIQIFMKLIGYPFYTYSTVVFVLLFSAGMGSLFSKTLGVSLVSRWSWPFLGILTAGVLLLTLHPFLFEMILATPVLIRIMATCVLIAPLGFFLGIPFPLGILAIKGSSNGGVAWAWGLNGFFTVVGGLLSVLLSILVGFRGTLFIALMIYLLALVLFSRLRHERAGE